MKKNTVNLNEAQLKKVIAESVKRVLSKSKNINEISSNLLQRAADAAARDEKINWNDAKIRTKRRNQWQKFSDEAIKRDSEEQHSICPYVPEAELKNMPEETYVIMDGTGRNPIDATFMNRYSGHAGTKEQCQAYVDKYYDKNANWEYLPHILPLDKYLEYYGSTNESKLNRIVAESVKKVLKEFVISNDRAN